jgi:sulfatase maturation enzyme AslB (radical SAM superfamily)
MTASGTERDPLDLVTKLRQELARDHVAKVVRGERPGAPLVVELDPTSFCDLACPECISRELLNNGRLTRERLLLLSREMVKLGVAAVILIGGGEPLLHSAIDEVVEVLFRGGIQIGITTNGTQIGRHLAAIAERVSWTRVSVDAATPETYDRFRPSRSGPSTFHRIVENMTRLATVKRGKLGYSFLVMARYDRTGNLTDTNLGEVHSAARLAKRIGCDYFEVKAEYDMRHYLKTHGRSTAELLRTQIALLSELADDRFRVLTRNLDVVTSGQGHEQPKDYDSCPISEIRTLLTPTGAYLCPYHRGNPEARYGDPTTESLTQMWHGARRATVGRTIKPSKACGFHCIRHESNLTLLDMRARGGATDPLPDYDPFI